MLRTLLRLILVVIVLVGLGAYLFGWWGGERTATGRHNTAVGTSGTSTPAIDTSRAREAGAELGEKAARTANEAEALISDARLTAKIKSKMALDDLVRARAIDVTTTNHVVTLGGTVQSAAEHDRAVQLARETSGVREVVDHLTMR